MELVREVDMWLSELRAVFRRQAAFGWFVLSIWAFLLHFDGSGLSSLIRYFGLASSEYYNLLHFFHSSAFEVQGLCVRWAQLLLSKAPWVHLEGQPAGPSGPSAIRRACALLDTGWVEEVALSKE